MTHNIKEFFEIRNRKRKQRKLGSKLRRLGLDDEPKAVQARVDLMHEIEGHRIRIEQLRTSKLVRKLADLGLELPDEKLYVIAYVKEGASTQSVAYLTRWERMKVARLIRLEQRETWGFWIKILEPVGKLIIPLFAVLSGFLAALVGLISLMRAK